MKEDIGNQSQHYAGTAFDVGQTLTNAQRTVLRNSARNSGVWTNIEPEVLSPRWVHFDRRYGMPTCSSVVYPNVFKSSCAIHT